MRTASPWFLRLFLSHFYLALFLCVFRLNKQFSHLELTHTVSLKKRSMQSDHWGWRNQFLRMETFHEKTQTYPFFQKYNSVLEFFLINRLTSVYKEKSQNAVVFFEKRISFIFSRKISIFKNWFLHAQWSDCLETFFKMTVWVSSRWENCLFNLKTPRKRAK